MAQAAVPAFNHAITVALSPLERELALIYAMIAALNLV